jgi:hypothetical protein
MSRVLQPTKLQARMAGVESLTVEPYHHQSN